MSRENQGLQMALIIFVMLTVVLGVMVFVFVHKNEAADQKLQAAEAAATTARADKEQMASECKDFKRMIGYPTKSHQEMVAQFEGDMKQFAQFPGDVLFYSPILGQLTATIKTKDNLIAEKDKENRRLREDFARREKEREEQVAKFGSAAKESGDRLVEVIRENEKARQDILAEQESLQKLSETLRAGNRADAERFKEEIAKLSAMLEKLAKDNEELRELVAKLRPTTAPTQFDGEVSEVSQQQRTVWINRGSADGLDRQITFAVYPADASELSKGAQKASIEVTEVGGQHRAMARILEDKSTDPIVPGDKIATPLWSPGQQKHFALVGLLDLGGDGKDDHEGVKNLIKMNRGVIDGDTDAKGKFVGRLTVNTTYLIVGEPPSQGAAEAMRSYTDTINEAKRLAIRTISLPELKEQMGYRNPAKP